MGYIKCAGQMWLEYECITREKRGVQKMYYTLYIYIYINNWRQNTVIAFHLKFWIIYCDV